MSSTVARLCLAAGRCATRQHTALGIQWQAARQLKVDGKRDEPAASPWIKVVERPGDDPKLRSEDSPAARPPEQVPQAEDPSDRVPEKNPDIMPQAPIDPKLAAKVEANPSEDSIRKMAGTVNQALGGGHDFPKTGGASVREMASEIGGNISEKLGGKKQ
eukprot:GHRR01000221.1.p2 GENE.GHRR01000221.1~~GHRR01000221.1.p2  ORF type:complete len:160 (+),score=51.18 GHRR01000221.1:208-687(+)